MQQFKNYALWLGIFVCCMFSKDIVGQLMYKKSSPLVEKDNTLWVQYNPMTWVEPEVPISATFLYKKNEHFSFALDAGFFVAKQNYNINDGGYYPYSGYKFKPEVKYFFRKYKRVVTQGMYISLQGLIKKTIDKKEEWLTSNGQPVFSQLVNYKEQKIVYGLNLLFGNEFYLGNNERWMLDFYTGIGFRTKKFTAKNLPQGFSISYNGNNGFREFINLFENGTYPSLQFGMKFGYRIKGGK